MSAAPNNLPKRTHVLVKNLIFQENYRLTDTQTDIMAYIINAITWAIYIDGFYVLTTAKIISDLPHLTEKTLEASLRALKSMELIECSIVKVPQWKNSQCRGIHITQKGMEYNNCGFYLPDQEKVINHYKQEAILANKKAKEFEKKLNELQNAIQQVEAKTEEKKEEEPPIQEPTQEELEAFINSIKQTFGKSSKPICNNVKGWMKETLFYINSYNRLALITPQGEYQQLNDPTEINQFWKWLFNNPHRIGEVIDLSKEPTVNELNQRYQGEKIKVKESYFTIHEILADEKGVKIKLQNSEGAIATLLNTEKNELVYTPTLCEDIIRRLME